MSLSSFEPCFVDRKGNQLLSDSHCDLTEKEMSRQNDKIKWLLFIIDKKDREISREINLCKYSISLNNVQGH